MIDGAAAILLALTHVIGGRLQSVSYIPRSAWLSFAGGVSVSYVFVHLLPELHAAQTAVGAASGDSLAVLANRHIYLIAVLGLLTYYGLDILALRSQGDGAEARGDSRFAGVFWIHIGSFVLYNALVGYLVHRRETTIEVLLFALAMGFHFFVNDAALREHHQHRYDRTGRWLLALGVLAGYATGLFIDVSDATLGVLLAVLAGAVILNVLKEEVPQERDSRFIPFAAGLIGFALLQLAI